MAKLIVWSPLAKNKLKEIMLFFKQRNGNANYSNMLHLQFQESLRCVALNPLAGKATEMKDVRCIIPHPDYMLFYRYDVQKIEVVVLWDNRQDPHKLTALLK